VVRIALAPLLVGLILVGDRRASLIAAAVFIAGAATDRLDGYLARRFASATRTGAWLDPLADKLFTLSPVVALAAVRRFPLWAAAIFLVREAGSQQGHRRLGARGHSMPATPLAKWKTATQMLAILLYILPLDPAADPLRLGVLAIAVALTLWSGAEYFVRRAPAP